uniref:THAP-type domain-containing protein n=1 Tax=Amblyomma maculatum TaxID=34609 RepID=G3MM21_AMBMU
MIQLHFVFLNMEEEKIEILASPEKPSPRPARRRASRYSAEMVRELCNSDTECSDNDPDYDGEKLMKARHSLKSSLCRVGRKSSLMSSSSSEEVDEPDVCLPKKKRCKAVKKSPGSKEAKIPKRAGKRSWAPASTSPATPVPGSKATNSAKSLPKCTPAKIERANPVHSVPETMTPGSNAAEPSPALSSSPNMPEDGSARGLRGNPRSISPYLAPHNVPSPTPPIAAIKDGYSVWDKDTAVIQPIQTSGRENYYCCVEGCSSGDTSDKQGLWLFAMPENEQHMSAWDERLPINYERNRPRSPRICYRHFEKAQFVRRQQRLIGLKRDALPIKTERPESLCFKKEPPS